ncbi:MAG: hypothetical protein ACK5QX_05645, partial [bacterium]
MSATPSSQRRSSATITDENDFTMSDDASMVDQNHESDAPDDSSVVDSVPPTSSSAPSSSTHSSTPSLVSQSPDSPNIHLSPTSSAFSAGDPSDDSVPVARNNTDVTGDAPAVDDVNHPDLSQLHNVVSQSVVPRHTDSENVVGSVDKAEVTLKSPVTSVPQVADTTTSGSNPVTASPIVTTKTAPP